MIQQQKRLTFSASMDVNRLASASPPADPLANRAPLPAGVDTVAVRVVTILLPYSKLLSPYTAVDA